MLIVDAMNWKLVKDVKLLVTDHAYKEQARLNQATSNSLMARLETHKAMDSVCPEARTILKNGVVRKGELLMRPSALDYVVLCSKPYILVLKRRIRKKKKDGGDRSLVDVKSIIGDESVKCPCNDCNLDRKVIRAVKAYEVVHFLDKEVKTSLATQVKSGKAPSNNCGLMIQNWP
ncbi:hypothetical protein Tco_1264056 [Tanacetum coccineum]